MRTLFIIITTMASIANGHCPVEMNIEGESICANIEWLPGESKVKGKMLPTEILSPYLIPMKAPSKSKVYSKAEISLWKNGDKDHNPLKIPNLRFFSYMVMQNGHHHLSSVKYAWNSESMNYEISQMPLQEMLGCWSIRWTVAADDDYQASHLFMPISDYTNLSESENKQLSEFCKASDSTNGGHGSAHKH